MTFEGPLQELERGTVFADRYEVIEELGSGGMGKVYKVFDQKIKDIVALKLIRPELAVKPKTLERFREEIRLSRRITHRNVCRMHDLNEERGLPFITMEFVHGEDLKSIIRMMGRLSPGQTVVIGKQICEGLTEAHKLGIIHRDLKPRNIMIDREGHARIMDFGLARSLEEKGITGARVMVGTAEYMSPEQVEGKTADHRSDLYSVGIILFEMATGKLPFDGDSALSIAVKQKTEPPPDPRKINAQVPEALAKVILKCLEKDREKRYETAAELLSVLDELEKEFPSAEKVLPRKRPSVLSEMTRPLLTKKFAFPVLAIIALAAVAIIIWRGRVREAPLPSPTGKPVLAVLNFVNNTSEKDLDVWRAGLAQDLITELRLTTTLLTIRSGEYLNAILNKLRLQGSPPFSPKELRAVAETGVSYLLSASYLKDVNNFRVNYEIIDVRTREPVYSDRVEMKEEDNYLNLAKHISKGILAALKIPAEPRPARIPTQSALAYKYYSLGRNAEKLYKNSGDENDFQATVKLYQKAIQEDPQFSWPYWGLGDTYQYLYVETGKREDLEQTCAYYEKAYRLDPNSAGTNAGLGWAYFLKGDNDTAFSYYKKAFELEPDNPVINENIGSFYRSIGLPEQAAEHYSNAINLGGWETSTFHFRALCYERIGQPEKATEDARKALDMEPGNFQAELFYARMLINQQRYDEAEKEIAIAETLSTEKKDIQYTRSLLLAARGDKEKALAGIKTAEDSPVYYSYLLSRVNAILGLKDQALEHIQLGIDNGFQENQDYMYEYPFLNTNFFFGNLRNDPHFQKIVAEQKKRYENNLQKYGRL
jgi:serine/threonine-protein kinase